MFSATVLINLLLASAAFAAPSLDARLKRRAASRRSTPNQRIEPATNVDDGQIVYSANWAGAVHSGAANTYKAVTGTFTVPTPSGSGSASAWVGIDGNSCQDAILQTGVDFTITDGSVSYDAWYEWYPDYSYDFSGIDFNAGDVVKLTVTAISKTSGIAVIENLNTRKTVSKHITSSTALCEQDAEWIVEDFEQGTSLVEFANFGKVVFTDAVATTGGSVVGPSGATVMDIEQNKQVLTSVSISAKSVTVKYV